VEKTKPNTTKARIHQPEEMDTTQNKRKKRKPGLVAFYDIRPGNRVDLFSKEKINKGGDK